MPTQDLNLDQQLADQFEKLPLVVQKAIQSSDVKKRLQALATTHQLHLDKWQMLENEVMLTLLGFQQIEQLEKNIKNEVGVAEDAARALAQDISKTVFEPIREELERQLEHPEAREAKQTEVEASRTQLLGKENVAPTVAATPQQSAPTPPAPTPQTTVVRAPSSGAYKPGEASTERKSIVDDPYREAPQ